MAESSAIEWTDATFNPWIGCTRVSPACDDCYAARSTPARAMRIEWGAGAQRHRTADATWEQPRQWDRAHEAFYAQHGRRRRVFCASLADVFDNEVDPAWRAALFDLIYATQNLDWILLTKRIGNVPSMLVGPGMPGRLPSHCWLGATVINQTEVDRDVPKLLAAPARVRFLSIEPMLGPVDLLRDVGGTLWIGGQRGCGGTHRHTGDPAGHDEGTGTSWVVGDPRLPHHHHDNRCRRGLDWVIAGGESGPKARPAHPDWFRSLRDQCAAAGVPFLFKQNGEWVSVSEVAGPGQHHQFPDGATVRRVGKKLAGRTLDGVEHNGFPA